MEFKVDVLNKGFIRYLYRTNKQNIITATASKSREPVGSLNYLPSDALDGDSQTRYCSIYNIDNAYFQLAFSHSLFIVKIILFNILIHLEPKPNIQDHGNLQEVEIIKTLLKLIK